LKRLLYLAAGWIMVAFGVIGAILPVVPTVPFLLIAAAAFARSSPALEARLMNHPHFGPSLVAWRQEGAISLPAKLMAVSAMAASFISVLVFSPVGPWLQATIGVILLSCAAYVVTRPLPAPVLVRDNT